MKSKLECECENTRTIVLGRSLTQLVATTKAGKTGTLTIESARTLSEFGAFT